MTYQTEGGIAVRRITEQLAYEDAIAPVLSTLDTRRGVLLASSFEYPGRYTRWDMGFVDPPLVITSRQRKFQIRALNDRGIVLLAPITNAITATVGIATTSITENEINGEIETPDGDFNEEQRSRQNSVFTLTARSHQNFRLAGRPSSRALRRVWLRSRLPIRTD